MTEKYISAVLVILSILCMASCSNKDTKPPYDLGNTSRACISIPYEEMGGVKIIPVKLNGVTMSMIYDTGCSGISLSLNELQTLYKNGKFDESDIIGVRSSQIADGSIVTNGAINIRKIEIGEGDGIVLENVEASVKLSQDAPILLGNSVLDELASVEVDNLEKTINFYKK